jgi:steroid 5-alpha reductase family enzyme
LVSIAQTDDIAWMQRLPGPPRQHRFDVYEHMRDAMHMPDVLFLPVVVCVAVTALCFLLSTMFQEYSWVDRIWSVVPPVYIGLIASAAHFDDMRLNVITVLTALWGARLTFNYARKGGYQKGGEDYRWSILRSRMKPWQWQLFNLFFISIYQNFLLLLIALPAYTVFVHRKAFGIFDIVLSVSFLLMLVGEFIADQQQWDFHQLKKTNVQAKEKGFLDTGLWAYSRHPNFFFEQAQWCIVFGFAVVAAETALVLTALGPVLLVMLFWGSARFTESLTAAKYPGYSAYQRRVSQTIPLPPRTR